MNWENDSMHIGSGLFTRWRLYIPGLGSITVEHHDNCAAKAGRKFTCPKGWMLKGDVLFKSEVRLPRVKNLAEAKRAALKKVRTSLEETLHALPEVS